MDEVTKNMVTAQLKSAKTSEALHDATLSEDRRKALEAARLRQRENATTTNEVTVTVKAGQN